HRTDRRVRRLLAGRHLVQRQQLQRANVRRGEPRGDWLHVADIADAPAPGGRDGEQRDEDADPAAAGRRVHGRPTLHVKCLSTRSMPALNAAGRGSRLTITNDSRGKSKKYPGCTSTSSLASRSRTRFSSESSDGTCRTTYQPPSLRKTRTDGAASRAAAIAA